MLEGGSGDVLTVMGSLTGTTAVSEATSAVSAVLVTESVVTGLLTVTVALLVAVFLLGSTVHHDSQSLAGREAG